MRPPFVVLIVAVVILAILIGVVVILYMKKHKTSPGPGPSPPSPPSICTPACLPTQSCVKSTCVPPSTTLANLQVQLASEASAGTGFLTCTDVSGSTRMICVTSTGDSRWNYAFVPTSGLPTGLHYKASDNQNYGATAIALDTVNMLDASMTNTSYAATTLDFDAIPSSPGQYALYLQFTDEKGLAYRAYATTTDGTSSNVLVFDNGALIAQALPFLLQYQ